MNMFKMVGEAYSTLSDPAKKLKYPLNNIFKNIFIEVLGGYDSDRAWRQFAERSSGGGGGGGGAPSGPGPGMYYRSYQSYGGGSTGPQSTGPSTTTYYTLK